MNGIAPDEDAVVPDEVDIAPDEVEDAPGRPRVAAREGPRPLLLRPRMKGRGGGKGGNDVPKVAVVYNISRRGHRSYVEEADVQIDREVEHRQSTQ